MANKKTPVKKNKKSTSVKKVSKAIKKKVAKTKTKVKIKAAVRAKNKVKTKTIIKTKTKTKTKGTKDSKKVVVATKIGPPKKAPKNDLKKAPKQFSSKKASKAFISDFDDEDEDYLNEGLKKEEGEEDDLDSVAFDDDAKFDEEDDSFEKEEKEEHSGSIDEIDEEELSGQSEGSYSFGWGYSDSFDKPDEVVEKKEFDEDEQYASGASSNGEDDDDL